jgi:hypothetical protein
MANTAFEHSPTITVPGSGNSTDNAVVLWNGTTGNNFSNSVVIIDAGAVTGATSITSTEFVGGGVGITALNGTEITSGTVPVAQLGSSGSRNSSTFLNGANAWAAAGGDFSNGGDNGALVLGTNDANSLTFETTNTARMVVAAAGDVTISTGNVVIGTAGKGIDFSATANSSGSMSSELLDWYEEGTFSPLLYDQAGNAAPSMGATVGRYTRIGNRVHFHFQIQANSISGMSSSGQVVIRGLPFTSVNVTNTEHVIGFGHGDGFAITAGSYVNGLIGVNQTYIYMLQWTATTGTSDFTVAHLSDNGKLKCTGVYEV